MTQDNQQDPAIEEEAGGYGTPTAEQELPGGNAGGADQDTAGEAGAGRSGGTDGQMSAQKDSTQAGVGQGDETAAQNGGAVPSSEADMDEANTEEPEPGRQFSSESGQDAAGIPDGSGTDLPEDKSPKDRDGDDEESFNAG